MHETIPLSMLIQSADIKHANLITYDGRRIFNVSISMKIKVTHYHKLT